MRDVDENGVYHMMDEYINLYKAASMKCRLLIDCGRNYAKVDAHFPKKFQNTVTSRCC